MLEHDFAIGTRMAYSRQDFVSSIVLPVTVS